MERGVYVHCYVMAFLQKKQMCTPQQATALTESVLQMLIYDMRLLSVVDGAGFQQMIAQFNPDYILPFTHLMVQKYSTTFVTCDVWTSGATEHILEFRVTSSPKTGK